MSIRVTCPNGHTINVKDSCAGMVGLCPVCKLKVKVPEPAGGMSEDDIITVLGPHEPSHFHHGSAAEPGDSLASSSSIFSSSERGSDSSYSGIGGSSGIGLGSSSGIGSSDIGMGDSRVEASSPPKKICTSCRREISAGTHICPFCRTYIANLSDL